MVLLTAQGSITDPSGLLQLGHRFYWPALGRFIQQAPIGDDTNWYAYAANNPLVYIDPEGLLTWRDVGDWYMGGASDWVDRNLLSRQTARCALHGRPGRIRGVRNEEEVVVVV